MRLKNARNGEVLTRFPGNSQFWTKSHEFSHFFGFALKNRESEKFLELLENIFEK